MRWIFLLASATLCIAQTGESVFLKSCSSGYCHGEKGVGGGAPRLAARGFDEAIIRNTVSRGVSGTPMAAFASSLSREELAAVIGYVAGLNGITVGTPAAAAARPAYSDEVLRGRALFSDAVRGFGRCSTCHEAGGLGIAVATPIAKVPENAAALKNLQTPRVVTATTSGENVPVLIVSRKAQAVVFYDLTTAPPVLRTAAPNEIQTRDGSNWSHQAFIGAYSPAELDGVLAFLRVVQR